MVQRLSGGVRNSALATGTFIGGGVDNQATGVLATVAGGQNNLASGGEAVVAGGHSNTASGVRSAVLSGRSNVSGGTLSVIAGGFGLTLNGSNSFGFLGGSNDMSVSAADVAVFGNTDMWLTNNDNGASQLRFYEANSTTGAFPGTTNYTSFEAGTQIVDINYILPLTLTPSTTVQSGILQTDGSGNLSWLDDSVLVSGNAWALEGNAGTTPGTGAGENFLGTTDAQDLVIATDGTERMHVLGSNGNVGINVPGILSAREKLDVFGDVLGFSFKRGILDGSRAGLDIDGGNIVLHGRAPHPDPYSGEAGVNIVAPSGSLPVKIQLRNSGVGYYRYQLLEGLTNALTPGHRFALPWNISGIPVGSIREGVEFGFEGFEGAPGYGIESNFWGARFGAIRESGTNNTGILLRTTSGGTPVERMRITAGGDVGVGLPNPIHRLHSLNDKTQDEYAGIYGDADQNTTNQGNWSLGRCKEHKCGKHWNSRSSGYREWECNCWTDQRCIAVE